MYRLLLASVPCANWSGMVINWDSQQTLRPNAKCVSILVGSLYCKLTATKQTAAAPLSDYTKVNVPVLLNLFVWMRRRLARHSTQSHPSIFECHPMQCFIFCFTISEWDSHNSQIDSICSIWQFFCRHSRHLSANKHGTKLTLFNLDDFVPIDWIGTSSINRI